MTSSALLLHNSLPLCDAFFCGFCCSFASGFDLFFCNFCCSFASDFGSFAVFASDSTLVYLLSGAHFGVTSIYSDSTLAYNASGARSKLGVLAHLAKANNLQRFDLPVIPCVVPAKLAATQWKSERCKLVNPIKHQIGESKNKLKVD
jgi:hypothetical protein